MWLIPAVLGGVYNSIHLTLHSTIDSYIDPPNHPINTTGNEAFDPAALGHAEEVVETRVGDGEMIYIKVRDCVCGGFDHLVKESGMLTICLIRPTHAQGTKSQAATTIVLRGANDFHLDEMDRALHDSLMVIKRMLESNALVAGGGAVEAALSIHLEKYATTLGSKEQLAIAEFADALLVIPRTLAVNAAQVRRWGWCLHG